MNRKKVIIHSWIIILSIPLLSGWVIKPDWGFFGHRKINRMAVFTLPPEMIPFFKENIEYITEHAIDPDKRRYATKHEAVRHYIDIDSWGDQPFKNVPRIFEDALMKFSHYYVISDTDTTRLNVQFSNDSIQYTYKERSFLITVDSARQVFRDVVMPQYYDEPWYIEPEQTKRIFGDLFENKRVKIEDHFSQEGILPYHLNQMYYWLVKAFEDEDLSKILRLSAEFGHYIGDAHVPLHTTKNYNGQLTDQVGIHAFWESRLPELFADKEYSFLVGKAQKIDQPLSYFWDIVWDSHNLLDEVLSIEKNLRSQFPEDQQLCYDERLDRTIKTQCPEFSRAYHEALNGMVEHRMQDAILSIGSVWFSAWVDAGQPDLSKKETVSVEKEEIRIDPTIKTRSHDN